MAFRGTPDILADERVRQVSAVARVVEVEAGGIDVLDFLGCIGEHVLATAAARHDATSRLPGRGG